MAFPEATMSSVFAISTANTIPPAAAPISGAYFIDSRSASTFLTSVFGLLIGATFFAERLGWVQIVGVMLTLLGVHLAQRKGHHLAAVT